MIKSNRIGLAGIFVAMLGIGVAIIQDDLRIYLSPDSATVASKVREKSFTLIDSGEVASDKHDVIDFIYIGLGFVGLVLGVGSFICKENHRVSAAAGALGIVVLAWQYVLIGVVIAVAAFFLGSFA